jgi:hypothetical protein
VPDRQTHGWLFAEEAMLIMPSNNRVEFARIARPTRKGDAPLLAAHAER